MSTASFGGPFFELDGTNPVVLATGPATGQLVIEGLLGVNYDDAEATIIVKKVKGADEIQVGRATISARAGASGPYSDAGLLHLVPTVLEADDETLTAECAVPVSTANPKVGISKLTVTP